MVGERTAELPARLGRSPPRGKHNDFLDMHYPRMDYVLHGTFSRGIDSRCAMTAMRYLAAMQKQPARK
jgi:hypothetical protein